MAPVPGQARQRTYPSTVAYVARLIVHRYVMLGWLDEAGVPLHPAGLLMAPTSTPQAGGLSKGSDLVEQPGARCPECGNASVIHKDGCEFCTACGYVGACG